MTTQKQPKKAYSEKTRLGNPIPRVGGTGPLACRLKLSSALLAAADLGAGHEVELLATPGEIVIKKRSEPVPPAWSRGRSRSTRTAELDSLMEFAHSREKALQEAVEQPVEPLSDAQLDGEAL